MKIVLFDMDGTLTPAREKMQRPMLNALVALQKSGYQIGIVTGSDMNYLQEQCEIIFDDFSFDCRAVHYYPCNGTKSYKFKNGDIKQVYCEDMIKTLGQDIYRLLVSNCINIQRHIVETTDCPLTGVFFDYRGSMLNWCPIGRLAGENERRRWIELDNEFNIRKTWMSHLKMMLKTHGVKNVSVKLGGNTSFDIFPAGWDKTYVLRNFKDSDEVYFIGDRCQDSGNDKELYDAIKLRMYGESFETSGPSKTIDIIRKTILQQTG